MHLVSVNIGSLREMPGVESSEPTGIFKKPVEGPVKVRVAGLEHDKIGSVKYHGGPDQAVLIYSQRDYDWWHRELQREMPPGLFGENFTVSDWGDSPPRLGDRWAVGSAVLELSGPRIPCVTLAHRMGDPKFVKKFLLAGRSGTYARVLNEGEVRAGQQIDVVLRRPEYPSVDEVYSLWRSRPRDLSLIRSAVEAPVAVGIKAELEKWLKIGETKWQETRVSETSP